MNTVHTYFILLLFTVAPQILVSSVDDDQGIDDCLLTTSKTGWINDPCELLRVKDLYIITYQCNPYSNLNGNISWCQSVSKDLVNWDYTGVVIAYNPSTDEQRFTGTAVFDEHNTSGLGRGDSRPVVAAFTNAFGKDTTLSDGTVIAARTQSIYVAYTYTPYFGKMYEMYDHNPVIRNPPAKYSDQSNNFRDPFLMWYEPHKKWIVVIALAEKRKVLFYGSSNLLAWNLLGEFTSDLTPKYQWECPGLFEICVSNTKETKWVLMISTNPGDTVKGPGENPDRSASGSCMHYYVGQFNGFTFIVTNNTKYGKVIYFDYGADMYAGNVVNNVGKQILIIGWVNNWKYARNRTEEYKGALGFVRKVSMLLINGVYRLIQQAVPELDKCVTQTNSYDRSQVEAGIEIPINGRQAYKIVITFSKGNVVLSLRVIGQSYEQMKIYNFVDNKTICIQKISVDPSKNGALVTHCTEYSAGKILVLTMYVNPRVCVLFCDDGWPAFTELLKIIFENRSLKLVAGSSYFISAKRFVLNKKSNL